LVIHDSNIVPHLLHSSENAFATGCGCAYCADLSWCLLVLAADSRQLKQV
jgi:hypothetical protein